MSSGKKPTAVEQHANDRDMEPVENVSATPQPMLCPPACAGGGFAAGILGACAVERCNSTSPSINAKETNIITPSDSIDDILSVVS